MKTPPTLPLRLLMVSLAGLALIAAAGCQRKAAPTDETAADAPPAATAPAPAPTPAADEVPAGVLRAYVWHCADGQTLVMRNLTRERAIAIDFHDGTRRLDHTPSGSGARYADGTTVFWTKGSAARLERQGAAAVQCEERRADSLREDARARGVIYRALGNEPGWTLEIGPASKLSWTTNYGEERYDFEQAEIATAPEGADVYTAQKDAISIKASIKAERCVDDGDVAYDHVVTVESGGQTYRGCGTRLNAR